MKKLKNKIIVFTSMLFASFCGFIGLSFSQNNMAVEAKTVTRRNDWIGRAYFDFDDYDTLNIYDINISNKELEEYAYKLTILDNRFVNVKFENCIFENVSVSGSGSCIRIESNEGSGGNISFVNCKFINCSADDGGAIYITGDSDTEFDLTVNFYNNTIIDCHADSYGGFLYSDHTRAIINGDNSTIIKNCSSGSDGGAIYLNKGKSISNFTFTGNSSANDGGAILMYDSADDAIVSNCYFYDNKSKDDGGAIYVTTYCSDAQITNSVFYNNLCDEYSAVSYEIDNNSDTVITGCDFINESYYAASSHINHLDNVSGCAYYKSADYKLTKTLDGVYHIINSGDLLKFYLDVLYNKHYFKGEQVILENNVSLYKPIGSWNENNDLKRPFKGTFNGMGHTINVVECGNDSNCGLFSCTDEGAVVKNITIRGLQKGAWSIGGIVGNAYETTFINCVNYANVQGTDSYAGGIAGWAGKTNFYNCLNYGNVSSKDQCGGIAGCNDGGNTFNCYNAGTIVAVNATNGDFVGSENANVKECYTIVSTEIAEKLNKNIDNSEATFGVNLDTSEWYYWRNNGSVYSLILRPYYIDFTFDTSTNTLKSEYKIASRNIKVYTGGNLSSGWYLIEQNITSSSRVNLSGDVHLILLNNVTFEATLGIDVPKGSSLSIYTTSNIKSLCGKINAQGQWDAAIGGTNYSDSGTLNIYGGNITATGNKGGAGIGGGSHANTGLINIYGGFINASSTSYESVCGAGIGCGANGNLSTLNIYGGEITATGSSFKNSESDFGGSAGIGGGSNATNCGNISIYGGNITATGGKYAAGIGCGNSGNKCSVSVYGGTVKAIGGEFGAGIGMGHTSIGDDASFNFVIYGGSVNATGGYFGAGIGGGYNSVGPNFVGHGGSIVATGGEVACGIGKGHRLSDRLYSGSLTIDNGTISSTGSPAISESLIIADCAGVKINGIVFTQYNGEFKTATNVTIDATFSPNTHYLAKTYDIVYPQFDDDGNLISYGVMPYYQCKCGDFYKTCTNGILTDKISDIENWKNNEGRIGNISINVTITDGDDTRNIEWSAYRPLNKSNLNPNISSDSLFLEWQYYDGKDWVHYDVGTFFTNDVEIRAVRKSKKEILESQKTDIATFVKSTSELSGVYIVNGTEEISVSNRLSVSKWCVIILPDGCNLKLNNGICVPEDTYFYVINSGNQYSGKLYAYAGTDLAAIEVGGTASFYGGYIYARGGDFAAGIGGSIGMTPGPINIFGGEINSQGGESAAGIGGGAKKVNGYTGADGGVLNIYGGKVTAYGCGMGAAIGGGEKANGGTVNIYGGIVRAEGSSDTRNFSGAGIGGGYDGHCGTVNIYGGDVTAIAYNTASAIGNGGIFSSGYSDEGFVNIYGGTINAKGSRAIGDGDNLIQVYLQDGLKIYDEKGGSIQSSLLDLDKVFITLNPIDNGVESCLGGYNEYYYSSYFDQYFADAQCEILIGDESDVENWKKTPVEEGGGLYIGRHFDVLGDGVCDVCGIDMCYSYYYYYDVTEKIYKQGRKDINDELNFIDENNTTFISGWNVIKNSLTIDKRIILSGDVHLIICDGAELTAKWGINVPEGVTLSIYSQSFNTDMGKITVTKFNDNLYAGIGGNSGQSCGTINIHGGNVTSIGSNSGAGIGGGHEGHGGNINIYGGIVNTTGGTYSAGIGGGQEGNGGSINIYGGVINASSGTSNICSSAAIGSGYLANCGNINIYGGTIIANAIHGAAIGSHSSSTTGSIKIYGGNISGNSQYFAGIGGNNTDVLIYSGEVHSNKALAGNITIGEYMMSYDNDTFITYKPLYKDPTCEESGYKTHYYNVTSGIYYEDVECETEIGDETALNAWKSADGDGYLEALGHDFSLFDEVNHLCSRCGEKISGEHIDSDFDYHCDMCGLCLCTDHVNTDDDHKCDKCGEFVDFLYYSYNSELKKFEESFSNSDINIIDENTDSFVSGWNIVVADVTFNGAIYISGNVHLILADGVTLEAKGIIVEKGNSLSIYVQSFGEDMGKLISDNSMGVGIGNHSTDGGFSINIYGGNIVASGHGAGAAGIGSNFYYDSGTINIYAGKITATGTGGGAGIGGGRNGYGGTINIYGGTITANGKDKDYSGCGIGGGNSKGSTVNIYGGNVTAEGGWAINNGTFGNYVTVYDITDGKNRIITQSDINGDVQKIQVKYKPLYKNPTCEESGYKTYYFNETLGLYYFDEDCKNLIGDENAFDAWKSKDGDGYIAPLEHDYAIKYTWNGQYCTAKAVCNHDNNHVISETKGIYVKDSDATCESPEKGHYEAVFDNDLFESQITKENSVENGSPLGHIFVDYVCERCSKEDLVSAKADSKETIDTFVNGNTDKYVNVIANFAKTEIDSDVIDTLEKIFEIRDEALEAIQKILGTFEHEHIFEEGYSMSDTHHWHACTCGHSLVSGFEEHTFNNGVKNGNKTTYTCSSCGYSYTIYDTLIDTESEIILETIKFKGCSLLLSSDISINFYMILTEEQASNGKMKFIVGNREVVVNVQKNANGYYFRCPLNTLEIATTVRAEFTYSEVTVVKEYSVMDYINTVVENKEGKYDEKLINLCKSIANYGYNAQILLADIHQNVTIGGNGYAEVTNYGTLDTDKAKTDLKDYGFINDNINENIIGVARSLSLDDKVAMNFYIQVSDGYTLTKDKISVSYDKEFTLTEVDDNQYRITILGIEATNLGTEYTVTIDGGQITASALAYANKVVNGDFSNKTQNAMIALYEYYLAAAGYINAI